MANLAIDIGNTLIKVAVFKQNDLLYFEQAQDTDAGMLLGLIAEYDIKKAIVASVRKEVEGWREQVGQKIEVRYFSVDMTAGVTNRYKTPKTLGLDRLAAVIGAHQLYPDKSNLVIDAGTTITYDHIDAGGNYFGGQYIAGIKYAL